MLGSKLLNDFESIKNQFSFRKTSNHNDDDEEVDHKTNITHLPNTKDLRDLLLEELSEYYNQEITYNSDFSIILARKYYLLAISLFMFVNINVKYFVQRHPDNNSSSIVFTSLRLLFVGLTFLLLLKYKNSQNEKKGKSRKATYEDKRIGNVATDLNDNMNIDISFNMNNNYDEFEKNHIIEVVDLFDTSLVSIKQSYSRWMLLRIISLIVSNLTNIIALVYLKLEIFATVTLCLPIFVNILSTLLLNEKYHSKYLIGCLVSCVGGYIIINSNSKPKPNDSVKDSKQFEDDYNYYVNTIIGLISAFICIINIACTNISYKVIGRELDSYNINYFSAIWSSIGSLIICIVFCFNNLKIYFDIVSVFLAGSAGVFTGISYYFMFYSFSIADMSKSSYINYVTLPILAVVGIILFNETLNFQEVLGSCIILGTQAVITFCVK